jgi:hypothetical protein
MRHRGQGDRGPQGCLQAGTLWVILCVALVNEQPRAQRELLVGAFRGQQA